MLLSMLVSKFYSRLNKLEEGPTMASLDSGDFMGMGLLMKEVGVSKGSGWCEERLGVSDSPMVCSYCSVFISYMFIC